MTLEEIENLLEKCDSRIMMMGKNPNDDCDIYGVVVELIEKVRKLEEGIRKHRNVKKYSPTSWIKYEDEELYKLLPK